MTKSNKQDRPKPKPKTPNEHLPADIASLPGPPASGRGMKVNPVLYRQCLLMFQDGATISAVAEFSGVGFNTLQGIRERHLNLIPNHKKRMARKLDYISEQCADSLMDDLETGTVDPKTKSIVMGISIEKSAQIRGETQTIRHEHVKLSQESVEDLLNKLPKANVIDVKEQ
jgi:hypothetical protein|tara:strand:- start:250 stop:762 length:513 start_codon:yes stop_codon:yes gene_type:complete